ncbi:MAG TPA: hypothetical protein VGB18_01160 [Candidatus Thermoplasmatota archaeon]
MEASEAAAAITAWFSREGRSLPWRADHQPYHVLVAEFILQQTRMEVGVPRFLSFVKRFPTIQALARARESSVLAEWSGLGYYARARNLHRCAREIVSKFEGAIPSEPAMLRELPGIGPYTAGAIASIAFDRPEPSLDGNQLRVLGRFLGEDVVTKSGHNTVDGWARRLLAAGSPRILNQAIMDLGGSVCTPQNPTCTSCPLFAGCATRGDEAEKRVASSRVPVQNWTGKRYVRHGRVWLSAPRGQGLLGTHWLPPLAEAHLTRQPDLEHSFSHRRWRIWWIDDAGEPPGEGRWVTPSDLKRLPHGPLTRKFVDAALAPNGGASLGSRPGPSARRAAPSARRV